MMNRISVKDAPAARIVPMTPAPSHAAPADVSSLIDEKRLLDTSRRLTALYLDGKSLRACAKTLGLNEHGASQILKSSGIPLRPWGNCTAEITPVKPAEPLPAQNKASCIDAERLLTIATQVAEMYLSGQSQAACAEALHCGVREIRFLLRISGVESRSLQYSDALKKKVLDEYMNPGSSVFRIAQENGVSELTVRKWAQEAGLPSRTNLRKYTYQKLLNSRCTSSNASSAPASPTLPELHDQTGEALTAMQKTFAELTRRMAEMEKMLSATAK